MVRPVEASNNIFSRVVDRVISILRIISIMTVGTMAVLLVYEVIMRYVFNKPPLWVLDVVQLVQVTLAFTAAAPILKEGGHINMEILPSLLGRAARRRLEFMSNIICAVGSFWVVTLSWRTFTQSYRIAESSYGITLPIYPWKFLVPFCFFMLGIQFLGMAVNQLRAKNH